MLEVNDVRIARAPLDFHFEFSLPNQGVLLIRGPSGEGKSTLLDALGGYIPIDSGTVTWQSQAIGQLPPEKRPITSLFQSHNLFDHLTVGANLATALPHISEVDRKNALTALGVDAHYHKYPTALSGGQRQRVGLIAALLRPEPLVLLDEPFRELDPDTRLRVILWTLEQIQSLGKTLLLVSHNPDDDLFIKRQVTDVREYVVRLKEDHSGNGLPQSG